MSSVSLDLRHLPPPQPMERILDALDSLPARARLIALTPCHPAPLLAMLDADGYIYRVEALAQGHCVTICRKEDAGLLDASTSSGSA